MKLPLLPQETPSTDKQPRSLRVSFLGTRVPYADGMAIMRAAMSAARATGHPQLLLLEHKNTITKTRQHQTRSFRLSEGEIVARGIEVYETDRGGDVTFHGEGQLVGYVVMRLQQVDVVDYLRMLEFALLRAVHALGLRQAVTVDGKTGVWIESERGAQKLVAIGVGVSGGVTRHGFALNVTTDLAKFTDCIVPCGLEGFGVTSLEREMLHEVPSVMEISEAVAREIAQAFAMEIAYEAGFAPTLALA